MKTVTARVTSRPCFLSCRADGDLDPGQRITPPPPVHGDPVAPPVHGDPVAPSVHGDPEAHPVLGDPVAPPSARGDPVAPPAHGDLGASGTRGGHHDSTCTHTHTVPIKISTLASKPILLQLEWMQHYLSGLCLHKFGLKTRHIPLHPVQS